MLQMRSRLLHIRKSRIKAYASYSGLAAEKVYYVFAVTAVSSRLLRRRFRGFELAVPRQSALRSALERKWDRPNDQPLSVSPLLVLVTPISCLQHLLSEVSSALSWPTTYTTNTVTRVDDDSSLYCRLVLPACYSFSPSKEM